MLEDGIDRWGHVEELEAIIASASLSRILGERARIGEPEAGLEPLHDMSRHIVAQVQTREL